MNDEYKHKIQYKNLYKSLEIEGFVYLQPNRNKDNENIDSQDQTT